MNDSNLEKEKNELKDFLIIDKEIFQITSVRKDGKIYFEKLNKSDEAFTTDLKQIEKENWKRFSNISEQKLKIILNKKPMEKFNVNEISKNDLKALGLFNDGKINLPDNTLDRLLKGELTDFVKLENININGNEKISLDAKLSLVKRETGDTSVLIHPIYNDMKVHPHLTKEEAENIKQKGIQSKVMASYGKLINFGTAPFQNDKKNENSFFIEVEKKNGLKTTLWGLELEKALVKSNLKKGDDIQILQKSVERVKGQVPVYDNNKNVIKHEEKTIDKNVWEIKPFTEASKKEKVALYEFDKETKSFVGKDVNDIKIPHQVNGINLSDEDVKKLKDGKKIALEEGTEIQVSTTEKDSIRSNRNILAASMLLDGGISYVLFKSVSALFNESKIEQQKEAQYSKGYMEALKKVQNDLERKQTTFPNDKSIEKDLNVLKTEVNRVSTISSVQINEHKTIDEIKTKVNDPELGQNAVEKERNEENKTDIKTDVSVTEEKSYSMKR